MKHFGFRHVSLGVLPVVTVLFVFLCGFLTPSAGAFETSDDGFEFGIEYTGEVFSIVDGGIESKTVYLHMVTTPIAFDLATLANWPAAAVYASTQWTTGGSPTEYAGDAQVISNIDNVNTWKVFEAYLTQQLANDRVSVLIGLFDLNSEFDVIDPAGLFINSSFGIGPDYSQSGLNGPSIFPTASLALRVQARVGGRTTVRAAVFDAVAGDPNDPYGTHVDWSSDEGFLFAGELEQQIAAGDDSERLAVVKIGAWTYTEEFETLEQPTTGGTATDRAYGVYVLGVLPVTLGEAAVDLFARVGFANPDVHQFGSYVGFGAVADNPFDFGHDNTLGLGVAIARNGDPFQRVIESADGTVSASETALELSWAHSIHDLVSVQPDLQYIINPGTDPSLDNVLAVGVRVVIGLSN